MADILLSALPSHMQIQSVPVSTNATHSYPQLPPQFSSLAPGALLEGFVVNRDAQNNPILRTDRGDVLIKSDLFLKTGSEVVVRLTQQNGQTNARIISIDQQPIQQYQASREATAITNAPVNLRTSQSSASLQGVLLQPASYGSTEQTAQTIANILRVPLASLAPLDKGLSLSFRLSDNAPWPTTANSSAATSAPVSAGGTPAQTEALYSAYSKWPAAAPTASAEQGSAAATKNSGSTPSIATLSATVIGQEGGETVLRTSIGTIKLFTASAPPLGTALSLDLLALPGQSAPANTTNSANNQVTTQLTLATQHAHDWDSLRSSLPYLTSDSIAATAQQTSQRIPNTQSNLVNSVLFFVSALRGNDFQRWFGINNSAKLEEKAPGLLQRLSADFGSLRVIAADQPEQPWQMLFFPLMHDDELHQARLYLRSDDLHGKQNSEDGTRFVLEISLSQLGPLQIDGLVHGSRPHRQFDIVIRSETLLETIFQEELRALYVNAAQAAGLAGQLSFRAGPSELLEPLQEVRAAAAANDGSILA